VLVAAPVIAVFQPDITAAFELGDSLDLLAADFIDGLVDQLNDVEFGEGDRGPWEMLVESGEVAGGHVDTNITDLLGTGIVGLQIIGELRHDIGLTPLASEQQTWGIEVVKQADLVVSAPCGGLVDTDGGGTREVFLRARLVNVVIQGSPDTHIADTKQLCNLTNRHRLAQGHQQRLHQQRETAGGARPGDLDLGRLGTGSTTYARHLGMENGLILEEVQMAPGAFLGIVDRLVLGTAMRTGEAHTRSETYLQIDSPPIRIESNVNDFPGALQAECGRKQRHLIQTNTSSASNIAKQHARCDAERADSVWTKRECRKRAWGQVGDNSPAALATKHRLQQSELPQLAHTHSLFAPTASFIGWIL
jgi:hypothetical protein